MSEVVQQAHPRVEVASSTVLHDTAAIPERLEGCVTRDGESLVLSDSGSRPYTVLIAAAVAAPAILAVCALTPGAFMLGADLFVPDLIEAGWLGLVLVLGMFLPMPLAVVTCTGLLAGAGLHMVRPHPLRISPNGLKFEHIGGAEVPVPKAVRMESSAVGMPIVVRVVGNPTRRILRQVPTLDGGPWDLDAIRWFARETAATLGVPLEDRLDNETWDGWATDPVFRQKVYFDRSAEQSRLRFPEWHQQRRLEPESLEFDHHGLRVRRVRVEDGYLIQPPTRIGLHEILDVQPHFKRYPADAYGSSTPWHTASIRIRTADQVFVVGERRIDSSRVVGEVLWLADKLRELAADAEPPDAGSHADVPESLLDVTENL